MTTLLHTESWRRWSVTALGALLCGSIVGVAVRSQLEWTIPHYLQMGIPILLALGVAAYGGWLVQSDLSPDRIRRIALWILAGTVILGVFATWEMYTHILEGEPFIETFHELMLGMTEGAVVGGVVGYYDARRKDQYNEAERAQQELATREHRLRTIIENVPVILFAINQDEEITLQVGQGLEEVGIEQNQMVGSTIDDMFGDSSTVIDAVDRALDGESVEVSTTLWGRTYEIWYQPIEADGEITSVIGVAMDVTERHRREHGIRALHDAAREMMQETDRKTICRIAAETAQQSLNLPMSAIWLRADDRPCLEPIAWSDQAEELFGELPVFEPGESISWQAYEEGELRIFEDIREADERYNPETKIRSELVVPLGEYGVLNSGTTEAGQFDETDVVLAQLLAANTRAALERADREGELKRQTEQMEFFNSILRHDVLNGMTVIRGRAEFLADELNGEQLRDAETIIDWSNDITTIIQRVRTVLETLTGTGDPQLEPVNLSTTLQSEVDRVRTTYPEVKFETAIPEDVTVRANELLGEVLGNVITNAVDHNEAEDLQISIAVDTDREDTDDPVTVRIADNGKGIPDDHKETIFRRDATGHAKSTGSGFGLFFVDSMVAEYGGDVWVEDNDQQGAAFLIELPPATQ